MTALFTHIYFRKEEEEKVSKMLWSLSATNSSGKRERKKNTPREKAHRGGYRYASIVISVKRASFFLYKKKWNAPDLLLFWIPIIIMRVDAIKRCTKCCHFLFFSFFIWNEPKYSSSCTPRFTAERPPFKQRNKIWRRKCSGTTTTKVG